MTKKQLVDWAKRFTNSEAALLNDSTICQDNRKLFKEFFTYEKRKLKRINNLRNLDGGTYRTLYCYITRLRVVNNWFNNKPWKMLTKEEILKVYDDVEEGVIVRKDGTPFQDRETYYYKIMKGKPFSLANKSELAKEVIEFNKPNDKEVRFIYEEEFRKIVNMSNKNLHKLLFWLAFDYGENITSLLQLQKKHFYKQKDKYTDEPEYMLNLPREILKRSRKPRSEINNYPETYELLEEYLSELSDEDYLFDFGYGNAKKIIDRAVEKCGVRCIPNKEKVTWKDLRSSMACDLLKKDWTTDQVNARLGHRPSSSEIDKYVNFLAIDRSRPKQKLQQFELQKIKHELEETKKREIMKEIEMKKELENEKLKQNENTKQILGIMKEMLTANNTDMNKGKMNKNSAFIRKILDMEKQLC